VGQMTGATLLPEALCTFALFYVLLQTAVRRHTNMNRAHGPSVSDALVVFRL
jgi:hypothetical protein